MNLTVEWDGTERPFEGEFAIPVDVIPDGARVTSARVRVTPIDPGRSFVESITFGPSGRPWGANLVQSGQFIEVDFRARRTLAALKATGLTGARLQIDPGGTYVEINDRGAIRTPTDGFFGLPAADAAGRILVPSFVVARFKLTPAVPPFGAGVELTEVEVRSTPENVSLRLGDDPTFHTFLGQMTSTEVSMDFATLLQEFLTRATAENGYYSVPLVVHSDSIARLKLQVELEVLQAHNSLPPGVQESVLSYSFDAIPAGAAASLPLSLPPGAQAVAGATSVHFLGAFDDTRIAYGPVVPVNAGIEVEISSEPGQPQAQAQQFILDKNLSITGVDLLVTATTPAAQVQVDLRDDLGGKPGLKSVLPAPLLIDLTTQPSGKPNWVSVAFPAAIQFNSGIAYWLIVQRSLGNAAWGVRTASGLAMQQTTDGGLSWRQSSSSALAGHFRLRNRPARFTMPIHVFVGEGSAAKEVPLTQFESLGRVDFTLDTGELADAINSSLAASAAQKCSAVEHLDNREFDDWLRVGQSSGIRLLRAGPSNPQAVALAPDGKILYVLDRVFDQQGGAVPAIHTFDAICADSAPPLLLPNPEVEPGSVGAGLAITPDGKHLVAYLNGDTWLIDLVERAVIANNKTTALQSIENLAADSQRLYFTVQNETATPRSIRSVKLASLKDQLVKGVTLSVDLAISIISPNRGNLVPTALAVAPDGSRIYVTANETSTSRHLVWIFNTATPGFERDVVLSFNPSTFALHPDGQRAFVGDVGVPQLYAISLATGAVLQTIDASDNNGSDSIHSLSMGAFSDGLLALLTGRSDNNSIPKLVEFGVPAPEVWQITSPGKVTPFCLDEPFRIAAMLGDEPGNPASISQVVPASPGCNYEFSFWALATAEGAAGEILWRTGDCGSPRKDVQPIQVYSRVRASLADASDLSDPTTRANRGAEFLKFHRLRVQSPDTATGAEIRFRTTFDMAAVVDRVSFRTVDVTLSNGDLLEVDSALPKQWTLVPQNIAGFVFSRTNGEAHLTNNGIQTAALVQSMTVKPSGKIHIEFDGETFAASDPPFLQLNWAASGVSPALVVLLPDSPRLRIASINVPQGVTKADFAIQIPPGSSVTMSELRVLADSRLDVPINVYAEAPGELTLSRVNVVTDQRPVAPPVAPGGVCPATPPGDDPSGEECNYCSGCDEDHGTEAPQVVLSPSGRTSIQFRCPNCKTTILRTVHAAVITTSLQTTVVRPLPMLRKPVREVGLVLQRGGQAVTPASPGSASAGAVSLKAVIWIRQQEREKLERVGIRSLEALASAPETLVTLALGDKTRVKKLTSRARKVLVQES